MSKIDWLENTNFKFPDVNSALTEPDGLLAASERLTPELVIAAYQRGIFPWYSDGQPVLWWSPNPRCVLYPDKLHISRSFKRTLKNHPFDIKTNTCFEDVMLACAAPRANQIDNENAGTWITQTMLDVYYQLHQAGYAHSIEVWHQEQLVGGLYGLAMGDLFFGESMFSRMPNASKVAIHYICSQIKPYLLDAQVHSVHLASLGAEDIDRSEFTAIIQAHIDKLLNI